MTTGKEQTAVSERPRPNGRKSRVPLDVRRDDVIEAALAEFGLGGYEGASTSSIARRAGIQQPYIYAMFENKKDLFSACNDELNRRLMGAFREAATGAVAGEDEAGESPAARLRRMSDAYRALLEREDWARCHLQVLASAGNSELKGTIRDGFDRLFDGVRQMSGAERPEVARFFAANVMATAMDMIGEPPEMIDSLTETDSGVDANDAGRGDAGPGDAGRADTSLRRTEAVLPE
jgi:AcrR family transcriptional regulator